MNRYARAALLNYFAIDCDKKRSRLADRWRENNFVCEDAFEGEERAAAQSNEKIELLDVEDEINFAVGRAMKR